MSCLVRFATALAALVLLSAGLLAGPVAAANPTSWGGATASGWGYSTVLQQNLSARDGYIQVTQVASLRTGSGGSFSSLVQLPPNHLAEETDLFFYPADGSPYQILKVDFRFNGWSALTIAAYSVRIPAHGLVVMGGSVVANTNGNPMYPGMLGWGVYHFLGPVTV